MWTQKKKKKKNEWILFLLEIWPKGFILLVYQHFVECFWRIQRALSFLTSSKLLLSVKLYERSVQHEYIITLIWYQFQPKPGIGDQWPRDWVRYLPYQLLFFVFWSVSSRRPFSLWNFREKFLTKFLSLSFLPVFLINLWILEFLFK